VTVRYTEQPERPLAPVGEVAFHQWVFPDGTLWTQFFRQGAGYLLRFPELADFEVSADGFSVQGFPAPGVTSPTVEHLYLNQVMPLALSRQGKLVLHGSAVDIGGQGVAFLGESGRGKSTLAASFATEGTRFLTDDGLLLEWVVDRCMILPSHPSIRLWEDSQDALVSERTAMAPAVSFTSKSRFLAGPGIAFCDEARPLRRLFFLGEGEVETPTIEPLRPAEALIELVKHSFLLDIEARDMLARHFDDLSRLAALPIYYRLDYPRSYAALPSVREAVIRHVLEQKESIEHELV
jgi:hypothetical protein